MRRLSLTAAAIVSTAVLLTTTSVLAIAPAKVNMGTLKPQGSWKVGTVDQGSERYCAMVGTYNNNVVAAFARKTKLSQSEVDQLRAMIDGFEEAQK